MALSGHPEMSAYLSAFGAKRTFSNDVASLRRLLMTHSDIRCLARLQKFGSVTPD
jgi:hypothetical protein